MAQISLQPKTDTIQAHFVPVAKRWSDVDPTCRLDVVATLIRGRA
ncbi:hypothetical protein Rumeso_03029 [Rubellimicrobium mesophilum DSM 19309]|uniref:Uncharacterized protein n=1 Tax=Rubellimicrobium mesophilum DSM 19309 TaxID=442562 RepID=A0A017HLJ9_9RHOB|nr:hypothetical protein Rumeso_03029 [Rubellimicrobium mesophilum DSM 19309]